MFALSCLRRSLVERNSTSRHPRANDFLCAYRCSRATRARERFAPNDHLNTVSLYNALSQRIGIDDSGGGQTWTIYNGTSADALPYADFNGSGTLLTRYVSGPGMVNGAVVDELLARTSSGGTTAWYLTDKLDSVHDIVSSSGSVLDHIVYDSFGNILTETNATNGDRFGFAGMEYDATTGQAYDHARWYDAADGRFSGLDPLGFSAASADLYQYASNEPLDKFDPSGLQSEDGAESATGQTQDPAAEDDRLTALNELKKAMEASQKQAADSAKLLRDAKTRLELLELDKAILEAQENNANIRQQKIGNLADILRQQALISRLTKHATADQAIANGLEKAYQLLTKTKEVDLNDEDRAAQAHEDMVESQQANAVEQERIDAANTAQENWVSSMMCWQYPDYPW